MLSVKQNEWETKTCKHVHVIQILLEFYIIMGLSRIFKLNFSNFFFESIVLYFLIISYKKTSVFNCYLAFIYVYKLQLIGVIYMYLPGVCMLDHLLQKDE